MKLENKRVLVTGAHGFIGKNLLKKLEGSTVYTPRSSQFDLRDERSVNELFSLTKPDVVINLAASLGGIGANAANPGRFFYDNMLMGVHIMEACRMYQVEKLVNFGTSCSYPESAPHPVKEKYLGCGRPNKSTGAYGMAKLALITMADGYREQYGLNTITLIPANVYGPYDCLDPKRSHVIPALVLNCLRAKESGTDLVVWGTGNATREFVYSEDVAEAIVKATEAYDKPEPVNIGTGVETKIVDVARMVCETLEFKGSIKLDSSKPDGQLSRVFDVSRAKDFGFRATTTLEEGIKKTVAWIWHEDFNSRG